jgi:hypothetical protein
VAGGREAALAAPGPGYVHLAWGAPEVEFARAIARSRLDLRPALTALYRALRGAGGSLPAAELHPAPITAARMVRVLTELGLARYSGGTCTLVERRRVQLERSPTYVAATDELVRVERSLDSEAPRRAPVAAAVSL